MLARSQSRSMIAGAAVVFSPTLICLATASTSCAAQSRAPQAPQSDQRLNLADEEASTDPATIPAKIARYARRLLKQYDANGNRQLQEAEWRRMRGEPAQADRDRDGAITAEELTEHIAGYGRQRKIRLLPPQPGDLMEMAPLLNPEMIEATAEAVPTDNREPDLPARGEAAADPSAEQPQESPRRDTKFYIPSSRLPSALPASFLNRDGDGDGQLTLAEFAASKSRAELDEFARLDRNGDGVVTATEYLSRTAAPAKAPPEPTTEEKQ